MVLLVAARAPVAVASAPRRTVERLAAGRRPRSFAETALCVQATDPTGTPSTCDSSARSRRRSGRGLHDRRDSRLAVLLAAASRDLHARRDGSSSSARRGTSSSSRTSGTSCTSRRAAGNGRLRCGDAPPGGPGDDRARRGDSVRDGVGNHDQAPTSQPGTLAGPDVTTRDFNAVFGVSRFEGRSYYGGHFGTNNDNSYQLFSAGRHGLRRAPARVRQLGVEHPARAGARLGRRGAGVPSRSAGDRRLARSAVHVGGVSRDDLRPFSLQGQAIFDALADNPTCS